MSSGAPSVAVCPRGVGSESELRTRIQSQADSDATAHARSARLRAGRRRGLQRESRVAVLRAGRRQGKLQPLRRGCRRESAATSVVQSVATGAYRDIGQVKTRCHLDNGLRAVVADLLTGLAGGRACARAFVVVGRVGADVTGQDDPPYDPRRPHRPTPPWACVPRCCNRQALAQPAPSANNHTASIAKNGAASGALVRQEVHVSIACVPRSLGLTGSQWLIHINASLGTGTDRRLRVGAMNATSVPGAHPRPMTIGRLAKAAQVGVETIRYQGRGLLPVPRATGAVRHYPSDLVDRIGFIKRAQGLGFSLQGDLHSARPGRWPQPPRGAGGGEGAARTDTRQAGRPDADAPDLGRVARPLPDDRAHPSVPDRRGTDGNCRNRIEVSSGMRPSAPLQPDLETDRGGRLVDPHPAVPCAASTASVPSSALRRLRARVDHVTALVVVNVEVEGCRPRRSTAPTVPLASAPHSSANLPGAMLNWRSKLPAGVQTSSITWA